ncbi:putative acylphosphatase-2 [Waddlia chondrophila WSU 86-1044]|uniref:acylphosphatase n=2 Tax=Waddlia chondrophila TaxID=71667 RepID=D6YTA9_WADCW|nr:putative acylphosphatase-2 [Waddlia chondrophila WSU 86-1044]
MHAIVHGRVQGVFFRDTTKRKASEMGISGTVENLPDGTVEIFAIGKREDLENLIEELSGKKGPGYVKNVDISFREPAHVYDGFRIIFS